MSGETSNKTREKLRTAFFELLEEKPLKHITVNDIVRQCGFNRNTFYYHYSDIPALAEEAVNSTVQQILSNRYDPASLEETFGVAVDFVMEHKRAVMNLHKSSDRELYEKYLMKIISHVTDEYFRASGLTAQLGAEDAAVAVGAVKCLCFGYIISWLDNGMKDDIRSDFSSYLQLRRRLVF